MVSDEEKKRRKKAIVYLISAIATALGIAFGCTSCNVVRTVTTSAESIQRGDTSVIIQTKTIESYTGQKL